MIVIVVAFTHLFLLLINFHLLALKTSIIICNLRILMLEKTIVQPFSLDIYRLWASFTLLYKFKNKIMRLLIFVNLVPKYCLNVTFFSALPVNKSFDIVIVLQKLKYRTLLFVSERWLKLKNYLNWFAIWASSLSIIYHLSFYRCWITNKTVPTAANNQSLCSTFSSIPTLQAFATATLYSP